jgi:hypothetical protein
MKRSIAALGVVGVLSTGDAHAQSVTYVTPRPTTERTVTEPVRPNRGFIAAGSLTLLSSYLPALAVAATSSQPADDRLYIPLAGPWLDLAERPPCGPGSIPCDQETLNRVLLVGTGLAGVAGIGLLVAGFVVPERRTVTTVQTARLVIGPGRIGVVGTF